MRPIVSTDPCSFLEKQGRERQCRVALAAERVDHELGDAVEVERAQLHLVHVALARCLMLMLLLLLLLQLLPGYLRGFVDRMPLQQRGGG